ncbi:hypothetical protein HBA55_05655 [Pseudomaricurvus alkylphenolicus]|uniref:SGNH/GDSL hydrolase family protein n=1 Tax=Pseudomaricurvus alkylphenolicus TaxID=1306991 RepID=UPI00141D9C15|nr:SGNH/GDSL hydrolase family protein [Pseudomaricurvus alkylphenolicus]NIB39061.1 hypothetical protein [Pseudomaricurvus alkylphenolicus]
MVRNPQWISLSGASHLCSGLSHSLHGFYRLAPRTLSALPDAVAEQSRFPAGVKIRFASDTSRLHLQALGSTHSKGCGIDLLVDGIYWKTVHLRRGELVDQCLFRDLPRQSRQFELYLPHQQEVDSLQIGVDEAGTVSPLQHAEAKPLLLYGSSIAQGAGAQCSYLSYASIIGRELNRELFNFGFYGAGRAEPEVVACFAECSAAAVILDLGKSYGTQPVGAYRQMLSQIREAQPQVPILCVTPIFSSREFYDPRFAQLSDGIRSVVAEAASEMGDRVSVVDGLALLGRDDWRGLCNDGLHPNEMGFSRIAERLLPTLQQAMIQQASG